MNSLLILCVLGMVTMTIAGTSLYPRGCIWIEGRCERECPEGTHDYTTGCNQVMPEATCKEPNPVLESDITCDYSECYCDPPTVRDEDTKKCVHLHECPKKDVKEEVVVKEEAVKEDLVKEEVEAKEEKVEDNKEIKEEKDIKV